MTLYAYDRIGTVRAVDDDGRLHVKRTPISKANICPYFGREIPGFERLGLEPDRQYRLYRSPEELERGAPTFNGLQVLDGHTPVNADNPRRDKTVGAMGTDAIFDAPYLTNSMTIWDSDAIARIRDGTQRELSCAYAYTPDMTPGHHDGEAYDGVMRALRGNHVALVDEGRAGPDVFVADELPKELRGRRAMDDTQGGLMDQVAMLRSDMPDLSDDEIRQLLSEMIAKGNSMKGGEQTAAPAQDKNMEEKMNAYRAKLEAAGIKGEELESLMSDCAAMCGGATDEGATATNSGIPDSAPAVDAEHPELDEWTSRLDDMGVPPELKDRLKKEAAEVFCPGEALDEDPEEAKANEIEGGEKANRTLERERREGNDPSGASDAAIKRRVDRAVQAALAQDRAQSRAAEEARRVVRPLVGDVLGMDSAPQIYKYALGKKGIACDGVNEAGLKALVQSQLGTLAPRRPTVAQDSATKGYTAPRKL